MSFSGSSEAHCLPPILPCQPHLLSGLSTCVLPSPGTAKPGSTSPLRTHSTVLPVPAGRPGLLPKQTYAQSFLDAPGWQGLPEAESSCLGAMLHPLAQTSSHLFCLKDEQGGPRGCTGPTSGTSKQILSEFARSTVLRARSLHRD